MESYWSEQNSYYNDFDALLRDLEAMIAALKHMRAQDRRVLFGQMLLTVNVDAEIIEEMADDNRTGRLQ